MKTINKKTSKRLNLEIPKLLSGSHSSPDKGMCIMEAVAFLAGENHSDRPTCACPVIGAFLRRWNDGMKDDERQQLKRYIPLLIESKSTAAVERKRAYLAADWAIRIAAPMALRVAKLDSHADKLSALPAIIDWQTYKASYPVIIAARDAAREARREKYNYWAVAAAVAAVAVAAVAAEAEAEAEAEAAVVVVKKLRADLTVSAHDLIDRMLAIKE